MKKIYLLLILSFVNIVSAPVTANDDEDLYERITALEARMNRFENELAVIKSEQSNTDTQPKQKKKAAAKDTAKHNHSR
jgi:hypothetical protein